MARKKVAFKHVVTNKNPHLDSIVKTGARKAAGNNNNNGPGGISNNVVPRQWNIVTSEKRVQRRILKSLKNHLFLKTLF